MELLLVNTPAKYIYMASYMACLPRYLGSGLSIATKRSKSKNNYWRLEAKLEVVNFTSTHDRNNIDTTYPTYTLTVGVPYDLLSAGLSAETLLRICMPEIWLSIISNTFEESFHHIVTITSQTCWVTAISDHISLR